MNRAGPDAQVTARAAGSSDVTVARALYFGYYMALGALLPYLTLYYQRNGLSGVQIGTLTAIGTLVSSPAAILWSGIADRLKLHRRMLSINLVAAAACVWGLSRATRFEAFIPIIVLYGISIAPIVPLLDSGALEAARLHGKTFGEVRVGGTIGWIISVSSIGLLIQAFDIQWLFRGYVGVIGLTLVLSLFQSNRRQSLQAPWGANLRMLLSNRSVLIFFVSAFAVAVGIGAGGSFFSLYLDGIGASEGLIGVAWAVASISEVPVMMLAGRAIRRFGAAAIINVGFCAYALRWLLFSFIHEPGWALAVQLLQGLSYGAFLTGAVSYLSERTPEGLTTTAQAIFNVVCFGIANLIGALIGGYLYDHTGMTVFFRVFSATTAAGLALFWLGSSHPRVKVQGSQHGTTMPSERRTDIGVNTRE